VLFSEGTRLGAYEITGQIGAGGMGEVYRATDTKLGREVAIKTLPAALASDKDRLARFEREARLLAALNHPHIAAVHSLDEHEGTLYLAMELVQGETLEEKLKLGALPLEDSLRLALQIAEALEAAHDKGVVHRDLKPANVMVTRDGIVKVLDFGLAKAFSDDPNESNVAQSPALSVAMTQQGLVLGTAGYMSPEQASGQPTDQRADIWAFGVVLYEMLTGLPLFSGESVPHILADVLKTEPDWNRLPGNLHPRLRLMLERCLTKKPRNRLHAIADARLEIEFVLGDSGRVSPEPGIQQKVHAPSTLRRAGLAAGLLAVGAGVAGYAVWDLKPEVRSVTRFAHVLPEETAFGDLRRPLLQISPAGDKIVYAARDALYVRTMSNFEAVRISQTAGEGASHPVFSPDGESIAYFSTTEQRLKRVDLEGGNPVSIAPANPMGTHMRWSNDDTILWSEEDALMRVPAKGGEPEALVESEGGGQFILYGSLLLGGEKLMYLRADPFDPAIVIRSLESGEETELPFAGQNPRYLETGHLVYSDEESGSLVARTFDPTTLEFGRAVSLVDDILKTGLRAPSQYALSASGTLAYLESGMATQSDGSSVLAIADADGNIEPLDVPPRRYWAIDVSPDGARAAVEIAAEIGGTSDIWIYDLSGQSELRQLTYDGTSKQPAWSPDGESIVFSSQRDGTARIYQQNFAGGVAEPLTEPAEGRIQGFPIWAPDGRLTYLERPVDANREWDVWITSLPDGPAELLVDGPGIQGGVSFSPGGDAMAYWSDSAGEAQRWEIFVTTFPPDGQATRISGEESAWWPEWVRRGGSPRLLYQRQSDPAPAVVVDISIPGFAVSNRRDGPVVGGVGTRRLASIPGTDELLIVHNLASGPAAQRIIVVQNWAEELKARVPTD
jgi:Tol biopolymer transport system component